MSDRKVPPVSARKPIKRKPKDKPKRPLSAYNFFFKETREKIIRAVECEDETRRKEVDPELTPEQVVLLRKDNGKISFEQIGKVIGVRWKKVTSEQSVYYNTLAEGDTERYKKDMDTYNLKKEELRKEKSRPSHAHYSVYPPGHHMTHSMQQPHSDICAPHTGMYASRMGYMPTYHTDSNPPHNYGQMPIVGSYNPYYMPGPPHMNEGHYANSGPPPPQSSNDSMTRSGMHPPSGPPGSMSYPPPPQSDYAAYPSNVRSSDQYSYGGQHPPNQSYYPPESNNSEQDQQW